MKLTSLLSRWWSQADETPVSKRASRSRAVAEPLEARQLLAAALVVTDNVGLTNDRTATFPDTGVNDVSSAAIFSLQNTGDVRLKVNNIATGGTGGAQFQFSLINQAGVPAVGTYVGVDPGRTAQILVSFAPNAEGLAQGNVTFTTNDPNQPNVTLIISGVAQPVTPGPNQPSNLIATPINRNTIRLQWTDNAGDEQGFRVYRATAPGGPFTLKAVLAANTTSYLHQNLTPGTHYYYQVTAFNATGASPAATANALVPADPGADLATAWALGTIWGTAFHSDSVGGPDGLGGIDYTDLYTFTTTQSSLVHVDLTGLTAGVRVKLMTQPDPTIPPSVYWQIDSTGPTASILKALPRGTYQVRVSQLTSASVTNYKLSVTADSMGDSRGTATTTIMNQLLAPRVFSGSVGPADPDWLQFDLTGHHRFTLSLTGLHATADVELLDTNLHVLSSSKNPGTQDESIDTVLGPGHYYVHLFALGTDLATSITNYTLSMNALYPPVKP